jgi:hypothetical protein
MPSPNYIYINLKGKPRKVKYHTENWLNRGESNNTYMTCWQTAAENRKIKSIQSTWWLLLAVERG